MSLDSSLKKEKIVAIISGGLDSTVMLWFLHLQGYHISEALTFNYGQRHKKEIFYSKKIISSFMKEFDSLRHNIIDLSSIGKEISMGSITGNEKVPQDMYDNENQRITIVPNRNMIFLSIAAGRAITIGANLIGYAAHASDYSVYPDCRPEFIEQLDKAIYLGNLWNPVNIIAPFKNMTKTEIVKLGLELNVPLELTWSCYEGKKNPCLKCGTCLERTEAFLLNQVEDPAVKDWDKAINQYNQIKSKQEIDTN